MPRNRFRIRGLAQSHSETGSSRSFRVSPGCSSRSLDAPAGRRKSHGPSRCPEVQDCRGPTEGRPHLQRVDPWHFGWIGQRRYQSSGVRATYSSRPTRKGQFCKQRPVALFRSIPRPFQAAVDQAQGQLAQAQGQLQQAQAQLSQAQAQVAVAEANQRRTQLDVDRYIPLAQQQAITQQELDNATQNNFAAKAQVQVAKAQVETARAQITAAKAASAIGEG